MIYYPEKLEMVNPNILTILNEIKDLMFSSIDASEKKIIEDDFFLKNKHTDDYLFTLLDKKPDEVINEYYFPEEQNIIDLEENTTITKKINLLNHLFKGTHNVPFTAFYPPGGYITWHHNGNAHGYNLLFSYSSTGEGSFKYYNHSIKEVVDMKDSPDQWTAKIMRFPKIQDVSELLWHNVQTSCHRISFALLLQEEQVEPAINLITKGTL